MVTLPTEGLTVILTPPSPGVDYPYTLELFLNHLFSLVLTDPHCPDVGNAAVRLEEVFWDIG